METEVQGYIRSFIPGSDGVTLELEIIPVTEEHYSELLNLINKNCTIKFRTEVLEGE